MSLFISKWISKTWRLRKTLFKKQFKLWTDIGNLTLRTWEVDFSGCFNARASFNFGTKLTITKIESVCSCSAKGLCCRTKQYQNDILAKLLKQNSFFSNSFHKNVIQCITNSKFLFDLNVVDVTTCYKKSKNLKRQL